MRNAFAVMYCPYSDGAGSQTCPLKIKQQTYTHTQTRAGMQKPIENQTGILFVQAAADVTL